MLSTIDVGLTGLLAKLAPTRESGLRRASGSDCVEGAEGGGSAKMGLLTGRVDDRIMGAPQHWNTKRNPTFPFYPHDIRFLHL